MLRRETKVDRLGQGLLLLRVVFFFLMYSPDKSTNEEK